MEDSLLIRELGIKSPMLKVLDFLMDNESFDYSKTDIAEGTGLSRATLFKAWPKLEALDLITCYQKRRPGQDVQAEQAEPYR